VKFVSLYVNPRTGGSGELFFLFYRIGDRDGFDIIDL
jgi:hypothetical protein